MSMILKLIKYRQIKLFDMEIIQKYKTPYAWANWIYILNKFNLKLILNSHKMWIEHVNETFGFYSTVLDDVPLLILF